MNWIFLVKTIITSLGIYVLTYFNIAWIGLILAVIVIWSQNDDLKSISIINVEQDEKIKRLEAIIEKNKK